MSADANKTIETRRITAAAAAWLDDRGFKPVETEVPVGEKWIADVASFCFPTRTEAQYLKLISKKPRWEKADRTRPGAPNIPLANWERHYSELPNPVTAVIEVKTTKADFQRETKFDRDAPAHLLYLAVPRELSDLYPGEGLLSPDENWGLLLWESAGMRLVRPPALNEIAVEQTLLVACQIAMRRDNFTRNARWRELEKQAREQNNGRINCERISRAVGVVLKVLDGTPVADALRSSFNAGLKLPRWQLERLEALGRVGTMKDE